MLKYVCERSFPGILSAIFSSFKHREKVSEIIFDESEVDLFSTLKRIETNEKNGQILMDRIKSQVGKNSLANAYLAFCSERKEIGTLLYKYFLEGFKLGRKLDLDIANPHVHPIHKLAQKVRLERHRFLGILRFEKIQGDIFYAPCKPDNHIITLLAPHFASRFAGQNWIIHDVKRELAVIYDSHNWYLTQVKIPELNHVPEENLYQSLWQKYVDTITIDSRENLKLQQKFLPKKYREFLTEDFN